MANIVITGDRSAHPGLVLPIVQHVLLDFIMKRQDIAVGQLKLVVGLDQGVEAAVRAVAKSVGIAVIDLEWMTKEWDEYALALSEHAPDKVYVIHGDAMSSKLYPALAKSVLGDKVELVTPELVFA